MGDRRAWRRVGLACESLAAAVVLVGATVRFVGDRAEGVSSILHHALAPAFLALAAMGASVLAAMLGSRARARVWAGAMLALIAWHAAAGWVPRPGKLVAAAPDAVRLVLWNAQHGAGGMDDVGQTLHRLRADVICLVEGGGDTPEERAFWSGALPEHRALYFGSGLIVLTRETATPVRRVDLREHGKGAVVEVAGLTLLLFDVKQGPLRSRAPVFDGLDPIVDELLDTPLVVLGDFNTPRDSPFFHRWRGRLAHAFEAAGSGYDATWPVPLPLLAIDHVWTSPAVEVLDCRLGWSLDSDHRPLLVRLRPR